MTGPPLPRDAGCVGWPVDRLSLRPSLVVACGSPYSDSIVHYEERETMKLSIDTVRKLTTKPEAEFLEGLLPGRIEALNPARLRQKLDRARRLKSKYQDLGRRQGGQIRGKADPTGTRPATSNDNTLRKVQLFDWAIDRIEARLGTDEPSGVADDAGEPREQTAAALTIEEVEEQIVAALEEDEVLSFGDVWARMPDVPVYMLRKALWRLSEDGAVDLAADDGIQLVSEDAFAELEVVEVDEATPAPEPVRERPLDREPAVASRGKKVVTQGHSPQVRIHSHVSSRGRRNQSRRDSK